jgi:hypothetical protein
VDADGIICYQVHHFFTAVSHIELLDIKRIPQSGIALSFCELSKYLPFDACPCAGQRSLAASNIVKRSTLYGTVTPKNSARMMNDFHGQRQHGVLDALDNRLDGFAINSGPE